LLGKQTEKDHGKKQEGMASIAGMVLGIDNIVRLGQFSSGRQSAPYDLVSSGKESGSIQEMPSKEF
jgi:hypothetical protein